MLEREGLCFDEDEEEGLVLLNRQDFEVDSRGRAINHNFNPPTPRLYEIGNSEYQPTKGTTRDTTLQSKFTCNRWEAQKALRNQTGMVERSFMDTGDDKPPKNKSRPKPKSTRPKPYQPPQLENMAITWGTYALDCKYSVYGGSLSNRKPIGRPIHRIATATPQRYERQPRRLESPGSA